VVAVPVEVAVPEEIKLNTFYFYFFFYFLEYEKIKVFFSNTCFKCTLIRMDNEADGISREERETGILATVYIKKVCINSSIIFKNKIFSNIIKQSHG